MRKQRNIVDYFPHDSMASEGDTITILESRFGNDGYAFWFKLLERLAHTDDHFLDCNDSVKWQLMCAKAHVAPERAKAIMESLAELDAIDSELWQSGIAWCQKLVNNFAEVYKNRRRDLPQKPITTGKKAITTVVMPFLPVEKVQSRVEESKNSKLPYGSFENILLTDEEHRKLIERFTQEGTTERIEELSCGVESKGLKYKSHYATILNWDRRAKEINGKRRGATEAGGRAQGSDRSHRAHTSAEYEAAAQNDSV